MEPRVQQFRVGDYVKVTAPRLGLIRDYRGQVLTITEVRGAGYRAVAPDGVCMSVWPEEVVPTSICVPTTTLKPGDYAATVAEDGTLTLTPVQEKAEEAKPPEMKLGSVWRDDIGDIVLIARVDADLVQAVVLTRPRQYWGEPKPADLYAGREGSLNQVAAFANGKWQFIASSLSEALESGKITAADLK